MPDDAIDPSELSIEPLVRPISQLDLSVATPDSESVGVLPPFSGLLSRSRHGRATRPGPQLEYLTLGPLVVQHIQERTTRETTIKRAQQTELTGETSEPADTSADSTRTMTVKEFIQQEETEDDGEATPDIDHPDVGHESPSLDADALEPRRTNRETVVETRRTHRLFDDGTRQMTGEDAAGDAERHVDAPSGPGTGQAPGEREASTASADDQEESPPWTTLERPDPERGDPATPESGGDGLSQFNPGSTQKNRQVRSTERGGGSDRPPELVLPDRPVPTAPSDSDAESDGPALTVRTREPSTPDAATGPETVVQTETRSQPTTSHQRTIPTERDQTTTSRPDTRHMERDGSDDEQPLALDFDEVPRPTLDRFVEQLSEELDRHERIERERRGL